MLQLLQADELTKRIEQSRDLLPNFLIVGAAKSGTTSLYHYLRQHPDIFMPSVKETNFFLGAGETVVEEVGLNGESKTISRVSSLADYQALFERAMTKKARGEASPKYLYYSETAQHIKSEIPDVKIIVILRHPVDRAYSAFLHHVRENQEEHLDFATALHEEPKRIEKGVDPKYHYRNRGFYFRQLVPYYEAFGAENIHVYLYEDLRNDPLSIMRDLFSVLGVDSAFTPDVSAKHNVSGIPKNQVLHKFYHFLQGDDQNIIKRLAKRSLPVTLRQRLRGRVVRNLQRTNLTKPSLLPGVRNDLLVGYKEDILQLQDLIKRDLKHWLR